MTKEITKADGPKAIYWETEFKQQCINLLSTLKKMSDNFIQVPNEKLGDTFDFTHSLSQRLDEMNEYFKGRIRTYVGENGKIATEAGTKRLMVGDYELEIQPQSTKLDDAKVEQLLRMNGLDPEQYMNVKKTYTVNNDRLQMLVAEKKLLQEEVNACMGKKKEYKVMAPKPMKDIKPNTTKELEE